MDFNCAVEASLRKDRERRLAGTGGQFLQPRATPSKSRTNELIRTECVNGVVTMSYSGSFADKRYYVTTSGYSLITPDYHQAVAKFRELSSSIVIPM